MNEIVKYKNEMNTLNFKGFTKVDMNFFMTLCAKVRNLGTEEITFHFDHIKKLTNYTSTDKKDFIGDLERMNDKLQKITGRFETESKILKFTLFPTFEIDKDNNKLTVSINPKFAYLLNDVIAPFTRFDLQEFIELESKYSKNLYRLLKQWKSTGKMIISDIADFREKLDCPKSYSNGIFVRDIINPSVNELQKIFTNLKCEPTYAKQRGKPLIGFVFTFALEEPLLTAQTNHKSSDGKTLKKNNEQAKVKKGSSSAEKYNSYPQRAYTSEQLNELEKKLLEIASTREES